MRLSAPTQTTSPTLKEKETEMEFWNKARSFAEEAGKRSQEFSIGSSKLSDIVLETAKRSKEIAEEATKRADVIKTEAIKRADQIKSLAEGIAPVVALNLADNFSEPQQHLQDKDLETFGVTDELREFMKGITATTFRDFPLPDDTEVSHVPTVSNVRQDLTEFQEKHAHLVLSAVKEISKLRYVLCPRFMRERKFWRIYFILANSHLAPFEKRYAEEAKQKTAEQEKKDEAESSIKAVTTSIPEVNDSNGRSKPSTSSSTDQDLDVFLLGGDSDDTQDEGCGGFEDDLDKIEDISEDEKEKESKHPE